MKAVAGYDPSRASKGQPRMRAGMRLMEKLVLAGADIGPDGYRRAYRWALAVVDDESQSPSTRRRAASLMERISSAVAANAEKLDRMERLESGDATENVGSFVVEVPRPRERIDDDTEAAEDGPVRPPMEEGGVSSEMGGDGSD